MFINSLFFADTSNHVIPDNIRMRYVPYIQHSPLKQGYGEKYAQAHVDGPL